MNCNVRFERGTIFIDETKFNRYGGGATNVRYRIISNKMIVTGEYVKYAVNDSYHGLVDMEEVDESEIITYTPWWSTKPRKKVREGVVKLKKNEPFKFIGNNYVIKKITNNEHITDNELCNVS